MSKSIKTFSCVSSVSCPSYLAVSQTVKGENQENPTAENYFKINLNFSSLMSSDRGSYEIFDAVNLSSHIVFS